MRLLRVALLPLAVSAAVIPLDAGAEKSHTALERRQWDSWLSSWFGGSSQPTTSVRDAQPVPDVPASPTGTAPAAASEADMSLDQWLANSVRWIATQASGAMDNIGGMLGNAAQWIGDQAGGAMDWVGGQLGNAMSWMGGQITTAATELGTMALDSVVADQLPYLLYTAADRISYLLSVQEYPAKQKQLTPSVTPEAKKALLYYGPYYLPGSKDTNPSQLFNMDPRGKILLRTLRGMPNNAAILSARVGTEFEDGSEAGYEHGVYIHHILVADMEKPDVPFALCTNGADQANWVGWVAKHIVGAVGPGLIQTGNDAVGGPNLFGSPNSTFKSAYLTGKDDLFLLEGEIVNYNEDAKRVFLTLELEYLPQKPTDYLDTSTMVLSATGCISPGYQAPKGQKQYNHTSDPFTVPRDGWIINSRGHLHDGGESIQLTLNGKMICDSRPTYSALPGELTSSAMTEHGNSESAPAAAPAAAAADEQAGHGHADGMDMDMHMVRRDDPETHIVSMSWCMNPTEIKAGDELRVITYYDTEAHPMRASAGHDEHSGMEGMEEMGIMTTNFAWKES